MNTAIKITLLAIGIPFGFLFMCGTLVAIGKHNQPQGSITTPVTVEQAMVTAPVEPQQAEISFGKPTVRSMGYGMTKVMVLVTNQSAQDISMCTFTATFLDGDTILGVGNSSANGLTSKTTKTLEFMTTDDIKGYKIIKLETSACI